MNKFT